MLKSFKQIWSFSARRQKNLRLAVIFSFLRGIFQTFQMGAIAIVLYVILGKLSYAEGMKELSIGIVVCIVGTFFASYIGQISIMKTGLFMVADKRMDIGRRLKKIGLGYFSSSSVGEMTSVLTTTMSSVELTAPMTLISVCGGLLSSLAILIWLFIYEWRVGIIALATMILYILGVNWQIKISRRNAPLRQQAQNRLAKDAMSFLQGVKVIKAFSTEDGDKQLKKSISDSCSKNLYLTDKSMFSQVITKLIIVFSEVGIIYTSLYLYYVQNVIEIDKLILLVILSYSVFSSLHQAGSILSMVGMLDNAMEDVNNLFEIPQIEVASPIEEAKSNEIIFDHVSFSYGDGDVLEDINLEIKENSLTAIIGPSGSGKSTLCRLVPRFWDVTKGSITIGGADIRNINISDLMNRISIVFQDTYLFEDTILNNIRLARPDATLEEVRLAAKSAQCDDFVMSLPKQYDTLVREGGKSLSGGEKQRISIARCILKDAPIIILDEATSALDTENEKYILDAIDALTKNKTVIMIAHRMRTVRNADQIVGIKNGKIVEQGKHKELLDKNGLYSRFINERKDAEGWKIR